MQSIPFIAWCLEHLNYWTITLLMAIESSFIPFPSEVVVPPAAYKSAMDGSMSPLLIVLFATLGADIGALVNYVLARFLGRPVIYRLAETRFGHMCLLDSEKVRKAEEYFDRHGAMGTMVGRLVPAVRQLISIPAGLYHHRCRTLEQHSLWSWMVHRAQFQRPVGTEDCRIQWRAPYRYAPCRRSSSGLSRV